MLWRTRLIAISTNYTAVSLRPGTRVLECLRSANFYTAAKRLNQLGRAMGTEVESQNKHIDTIIGKTDKVDDQIAMNRARLDRIH
jgi:hypothetical protein